MHDSENERPRRPPIFWRYVFPVLVFILLSAIPYILVPFNDRALKFFKESFPSQTQIGSFIGSRFFNSSKNPYQITFASDKTSYFQYEAVEFRLAVADKESYKSVTNLRPSLSVSSSNNGLINDIFGRSEIPMRYDALTHTYTALWYPSMGLSGEYSASVVMEKGAFTAPIIEKSPLVFVPAPSAPPLKRSFSLLSLDSKELLAQRSILSISNREVGLASLAEWMPFLNVDAVLMHGAVSKTYSPNGAWDEAKLTESETLAKNLAAAGVQSALMVQMLELEGIEIARLGYKETKYQGQQSNTSFDRSIVSLLDTKRSEDIAQVLTRLQQNKDISYIGLYKFFYNNSYHNELRTLFTSLFPFSSSPEAFQKWKNYYTASYLRTVLKKAGGDKPYIAFFSASELESNPEILDIAFASGVHYAILDFKGTPQQSEALLSRLFGNNLPYRSRMILSYQIDFNDYLGGRVSSLETWQSSFLGALRRYNFSGLLINDIYKAMFGKRGPYSAYDWMLASAALINDWRSLGGASPLIIQKFPPVQEMADNAQVSFVVRNQGNTPLSNISFNLLPTIELAGLNPTVLTIPVLNSGESLQTNVVFTNIHFKQTVLRKKTYFIGLRANFFGPEKLGQVTLLPFTDPLAEPDSAYQGAVITNQSIQQGPRIPPPATPSTQAVAAPSPPPPPTPVAPRPLPPAPKKNETSNVQPTVETQKLTFFERQRLKRLQKEKEKEEDEK